jgi:hypothetical protein
MMRERRKIKEGMGMVFLPAGKRRRQTVSMMRERRKIKEGMGMVFLPKGRGEGRL